MLAEDEVVVLAFDEPIPAGEGVLSIGFSVVLNDVTKGLYRSRYVVNGEKKNMDGTQFASVDTRRCFPFWDEPALKVMFKIKLVVPSEVTALSNMPVVEERIDGDVKTVCYEESSVMSTYLVAFVVGLFDVIEDVTSNGVKGSLASYLKKYAFKNAKTKDSWSTLSEESGVEVNNLMNTWPKQKGCPVVSVKLKDDMLEFEQSQFCSNDSVWDGQWVVSLTFLFGLDKRTANFMLESENGNTSLGEFHSFGDRKNADVLESEQ